MIKDEDFGFIGWVNEDNHDKIWGYFSRPTPNLERKPWPQLWFQNCCIFWARRGRAIQFKADVTGRDLEILIRTKLKKGYKKISAKELHEIWPTFITEAEGKLMWEILAGKVK